jgi:hypothetical protein
LRKLLFYGQGARPLTTRPRSNCKDYSRPTNLWNLKPGTCSRRAIGGTRTRVNWATTSRLNLSATTTTYVCCNRPVPSHSLTNHGQTGSRTPNLCVQNRCVPITPSALKFTCSQLVPRMQPESRTINPKSKIEIPKSRAGVQGIEPCHGRFGVFCRPIWPHPQANIKRPGLFVFTRPGRCFTRRLCVCFNR